MKTNSLFEILSFAKTHFLFLGVILLLWLLTLFSRTEAIDFQIHDTYFVLPFYHLTLLTTILLGILGLIYWFFPINNLTKWMTIFHVIFTNVPLLLFFIWYSLPSDELNYLVYADAIGRYPLTLCCFLFFLLAQIVFIINLLIGLFK